jgi:hypothetical protein
MTSPAVNLTVGHLVHTAGVLCPVSKVVWYAFSHYFFFFLAFLVFFLP